MAKKSEKSLTARFNEAKVRFPFAMRMLVLAVKQHRDRIPRLSEDAFQGLLNLGVLTVRITGEGKAPVHLNRKVVPMLLGTRISELQEIMRAQREETSVPESGVRTKNVGDETEESPLVLQPAMAAG